MLGFNMIKDIPIFHPEVIPSVSIICAFETEPKL